MHWRTYAHVIDALDGRRYESLVALIVAGRAELLDVCEASAEPRG